MRTPSARVAIDAERAADLGRGVGLGVVGLQVARPALEPDHEQRRPLAGRARPRPRPQREQVRPGRAPPDQPAGIRGVASGHSAPSTRGEATLAGRSGVFPGAQMLNNRLRPAKGRERIRDRGSRDCAAPAPSRKGIRHAIPDLCDLPRPVPPSTRRREGRASSPHADPLAPDRRPGLWQADLLERKPGVPHRDHSTRVAAHRRPCGVRMHHHACRFVASARATRRGPGPPSRASIGDRLTGFNRHQPPT